MDKRDIVVYETSGEDIDLGMPGWTDWPAHRGKWTSILDVKRQVSSSLAYFMRAWAHKHVSKDDADLVFENHARYYESVFYKKSDPSHKYFVAPCKKFTHEENGIGGTIRGIYLKAEPSHEQLMAGDSIYVDKAGIWPELQALLDKTNAWFAKYDIDWTKQYPMEAARHDAVKKMKESRREEWKKLYPDSKENCRLEGEHNMIMAYSSTGWAPWSAERIAREKKLFEAHDPCEQYSSWLKYSKMQDIWMERAEAIEAKFPWPES